MLRKRISVLVLAAVLLLGLFPCATVRAAGEVAPKLPGLSMVTSHRGDQPPNWLFDGNTVKGFALTNGYHITLEHPDGIGSLYLIFDIEYGPYTLINNDTGERYTAGEEGFLHDFLDVNDIFGAPATSVTLRFENGTLRLNELTAYGPGQPPDSVQRWQHGREGETDLVLFSAHGDDEQIFFAGLLPYYAGELGYQVQVVYLTNHRNVDNQRAHEMLNGLWAVGVRSYPVFGTFGDYMTTTKDKAYSSFAYMGVTKEKLLGFVVEQLRKFRPKVAVGHDLINGEYGHGAHMLYAELLTEAVELSPDPQAYPELAQEYGVWDVPKTYLHLYPENEIVMDYDRPLERFGGKTAFQVTRDIGFARHWSQQIAFGSYITPYESALDMPFSPAFYGLYRTTVGQDVLKNDMFENLQPYTREAVRAAEEAAGIREEALRQEEASRPTETEPEPLPPETTAPETEIRQPQEHSVLGLRIALTVMAVSLVLLLSLGLLWILQKRRP